MGMKWILALLAMSVAINAEDLTTTTGEVYKDVAISRADPDGLVLMTDAGIEKVPFFKLSKEIQEKYGYDPTRAAAFANATVAAQREAQSRADAARAAERARTAQLASEVENRNALRDAPARTTTKPGMPQFGSTSLNDTPDQKFMLYGRVVQRTKNGLLVACERRAGSGIRQVEGSVWLNGVDFSEDQWIKVVAVSGGTKTYETISGAERMTDVYTYVSGGKAKAP